MPSKLNYKLLFVIIIFLTILSIFMIFLNLYLDKPVSYKGTFIINNYKYNDECYDRGVEYGNIY